MKITWIYSYVHWQVYIITQRQRHNHHRSVTRTHACMDIYVPAGKCQPQSQIPLERNPVYAICTYVLQNMSLLISTTEHGHAPIIQPQPINSDHACCSSPRLVTQPPPTSGFPYKGGNSHTTVIICACVDNLLWENPGCTLPQFI